MNFKTYILLILTVLSFSSFTERADAEKENIQSILDEVNELRSKGCYCGRKYMQPVKEVKWDDTLYQSALDHAKDMSRNEYFSHFSLRGEDIGVRMEKWGYNWQVAGENLGEGQRNFNEVLYDWKKSRSHCRMLMNPKVEDMAVARYGKYWVQHFGKKMPVKTSSTSTNK